MGVFELDAFEGNLLRVFSKGGEAFFQLGEGRGTGHNAAAVQAERDPLASVLLQLPDRVPGTVPAERRPAMAGRGRPATELPDAE